MSKKIKIVSQTEEQPTVAPQSVPEPLIPETSVYNGEQEKLLSQIENRFLEVAGFKGDLTVASITKDNNMQVAVNKEKSDLHGEVFTPLWLVDKMLDRVSPAEWKCLTRTTFDLCSGYGQFTVRMLRRRYSYLGERLNISRMLSEYHLFAEIQPSSCFRLLYVFGTDIRLLIGDVSKMGELPDNAEQGIWVYEKRWLDRTLLITAMFNKYFKKPGTLTERSDGFEKKFNSYKTLCANNRRGEI